MTLPIKVVDGRFTVPVNEGEASGAYTESGGGMYVSVPLVKSRPPTRYVTPLKVDEDVFEIVSASCSAGFEVTSLQEGGPGYVTLAVLSAMAFVTEVGTAVRYPGSEEGTQVGLFRSTEAPAVALQSVCTFTCAPLSIPASLSFRA